MPDWLIKIIASFGGPARQIINDIGNEKIFDGTKGEALLGRKFISASDAILATAESAICGWGWSAQAGAEAAVEASASA